MVYRVLDAQLLTANEFLLHSAANERTELVRGRVRMMSPASAAHGLVSLNIARALSNHVREHRLGVCFADSTGYALPNLANTVRAPDASFVRARRLPTEGVGGGFLELAPDLAVEVLSPSESPADLAEKLADYRVAGTSLVWVIDPARRTVMVIADGESIATLGLTDTLRGGGVVPGFACPVDELFEGLAPVVLA